ncbi:MAG TPA: hypothetical protein VML01_13705 [Bryobacterales bacterium]|nr:hypothetical protein [Bryobacterales bacterium]
MTPRHQILALLQVQWRTFRHSLSSSKADGGARASATLALFWYLLWVAAALALAVLPNWIGTGDLETALPGLLLFVMAYWQLTPLLTLSLGVSLDMRRMIIYPIGLPTLFTVECLLRAATAAEMMIVLIGLWAGFATAGSTSLLSLTAGFGLFILLNVFLSAAIRSFVERIFQQRRLREMVVVVLIGFLMLPQAVIWSETVRGHAGAIWALVRGFPIEALPSGIAADVSLGQGVWIEWMGLLSMAGLAAVFAYRQFGIAVSRFSHLPQSAARPANALGTRLLRGLTAWAGDPIAALVEKEVRSLWRSPRFRLPFFMGFTFGVFAWLPILGFWRSAASENWVTDHAVVVISLYSFLLLGPVMFLNRFGFDRKGAQAYFFLPISMKLLLLAKNFAASLYAMLEVVLIGLVSGWFGMMSSPLAVIEAFVIGATALLYLFTVGNYLSVRYPAPSNPDRISRGSGGHGIRAAVQFLLFPLSLAPVLGVLAIGASGGSPLAYGAGLVGAIGGGVVLYAAGLSSSANRLLLFRERFLNTLTHSEGLVVTE